MKSFAANKGKQEIQDDPIISCLCFLTWQVINYMKDPKALADGCRGWGVGGIKGRENCVCICNDQMIRDCGSTCFIWLRVHE